MMGCEAEGATLNHTEGAKSRPARTRLVRGHDRSQDDPVSIDEFKASLAAKTPPKALGAAERALWWDAKGDWDKAHNSAQEDEGEAAAWVHAYLHRKEGDLSNARYWYRRAGKPAAAQTLAAEWEAILRGLLKHK